MQQDSQKNLGYMKVTSLKAWMLIHRIETNEVVIPASTFAGESNVVFKQCPRPCLNASTVRVNGSVLYNGSVDVIWWYVSCAALPIFETGQLPHLTDLLLSDVGVEGNNADGKHARAGIQHKNSSDSSESSSSSSKSISN